MINCPNCGNPVREDAKFCGNCGVDVQAALAAAQHAATSEPQPAQYAYPQPQPAFGGFDFRRDGERSPMVGRILIVAVIVIAVACAFCCGLVFGFEVISPMFPSGPTPRPSATPTKETLQLFEMVIRTLV